MIVIVIVTYGLSPVFLTATPSMTVINIVNGCHFGIVVREQVQCERLQ